MINRTACFTGHRQIPSKDYTLIQTRLKEALLSSLQEGYRFFGTGGALGFDTMAAQAVLELRNTNPEIRLILVLPCVSQAKYWDKGDVIEYERIKRSADKIVYTSKEYTRDCMLKRNRHLVDNSSLCICYLTKNSGGTAYTVDYARRKGLAIVNLAYD